MVAAGNISVNLCALGLLKYHYSSTEGDSTSARLAFFFKNLGEALKKHHGARAAYLANESRRLCRDVLFKMLRKVVYQNPSIDLSKVFVSLPKEADTRAIDELVAPIADRVSQIPRKEGGVTSQASPP